MSIEPCRCPGSRGPGPSRGMGLCAACWVPQGSIGARAARRGAGARQQTRGKGRTRSHGEASGGDIKKLFPQGNSVKFLTIESFLIESRERAHMLSLKVKGGWQRLCSDPFIFISFLLNFLCFIYDLVPDIIQTNLIFFFVCLL